MKIEELIVQFYNLENYIINRLKLLRLLLLILILFFVRDNYSKPP